MRFFEFTHADKGVFHDLECFANEQLERGFFQLPPQEFWQALAKRLNVRRDRLDKYLTKFKEKCLLDYSKEEGWLDFIYFKEQQKPLSDAERQRRYRGKKKSQQRDENVTEGVTHKTRQESSRKENTSVTGPPPGEGGGAGLHSTTEQMVDWLQEITTEGDSIGIRRSFLGHFQTAMERQSETDRQEIIRLARQRGLTVPNEGS